MVLEIKAFANADDAFVVWRSNPLLQAWAGFMLERQDASTGVISQINNRIPAAAGTAAEVPAAGLSSSASPIRRCAWMDHGLSPGDRVRYRVTPMIAQAGGFSPVIAAQSAWSDLVVASAEGANGVSAYFNRGMLMSQIVSRLVDGDVTPERLRVLVDSLREVGSPARRYLSGQARHAILDFLAAADRRGSQIHAALYEVNDPELIDALKTFGARGHVLIGNGGATRDGIAEALRQAGLTVRHRDLSNGHGSSPSVHNKFVVETEPQGGPTRVLTGSTNWTVTGLCTQLNNVLVLPSAPIAARYRQQWHLLVAAGDAMPASLKQSNAQVTTDRHASVSFTATNDHPDLDTIETMIRNARQGCLFLMFMPGQSPLLEALLERSREVDGPYIRGMVSTVSETATGQIAAHRVTVITKGQDPKDFNADILLPDSPNRPPAWAKEEFDRQAMFAAGLQAIVHSKTIVIDPFSDDPIVVTGSHNFSSAASARNDENLVIIRGDKALAQRYAVHIQGVYDAFAWRAFLIGGGDSQQVYSGLDRWIHGAKRVELDFWMGQAGPPQAYSVSATLHQAWPAGPPAAPDATATAVDPRQDLELWFNDDVVLRAAPEDLKTRIYNRVLGWPALMPGTASLSPSAAPRLPSGFEWQRGFDGEDFAAPPVIGDAEVEVGTRLSGDPSFDDDVRPERKV